MSAAPASQPSLESLSCNICFIVWDLVIEIGQNMLGMIICWMPAVLFEDSKGLEYFTVDRWKPSPTLYFSSNLLWSEAFKMILQPSGKVHYAAWFKTVLFLRPWPALCSDKKRISVLTDNSDSTCCCSFVRLCSLVSHLLIHGIVYKDSHDYLMLSFCELKNYCSSCQSDSIF